MEIQKHLKRFRPEIDRIIRKYLPKRASKKWLSFAFGRSSVSQTNLRVAQECFLDPLWNFLERGGKRWRPFFFLLLTKALGGKAEKVKDIAVILELTHQGSLIVDDLEDNSRFRRSAPCLHRLYGVDVAINAGNLLYFLPFLTLEKNKNRFPCSVLTRAYQACIQEMTNVHLGQGMDIYWHKGRKRKIEEKEYLRMASFKTGSLARLTARLACIFSGVSEPTSKKLEKAAEKIGIAFQIQDDILDITLRERERKKFGKEFGNDIKEGKRTLIVLRTLKKAKPKERKQLLAILDKHPNTKEEIRRAIEIIRKYDGVEQARKTAQRLLDQGWRIMDKILVPSKAKEDLRQLVYYLGKREV
ncbi:polyprenyl synthetase family protein [bacterium]|nr:polyprenyl synthetase family protein [bacterium]